MVASQVIYGGIGYVFTLSGGESGLWSVDVRVASWGAKTNWYSDTK